MKISEVPEQIIDAAVESLQEKDGAQFSHLSEQQRVDAFDAFYDIVVKALKQHGSFSDGGLEEADFTSSRYVDPSAVMVVSSSVPISEAIMAALITELRSLPGIHSVVFDGVGRVAVFSDGRVLVSK